ncbi:family 43 glycosylhydrolase [Microvirga terrae]|uniref:Family 43 glycosylhydrolase n=1 Tax=Microvirga terrae TaxID=2740529 RepID=A0ABY5RWL3_9HYPH|nr:family 43 glycosylhydrolase [Microvirga terrae]UVF21640.1 family 43 glycosylhydrolase [Microvirga terrae]
MTTQRHDIVGREQDHYLDLFEWIANSFGSRLPRNRSDGEVSSHVLPCRVLLDRNIAPEIWYGYGDPAVTKVPAARTGDGDWYYLFVTSNDAPNSFPILRSRTLDHWELSGFAFPSGRKPSWAEDGLNVSDFWAPEMHMVGDQFFLCFTAREHGGSLAIGLARSSRPEGPYESDPAPLVSGGVIDPHFLVDRMGRTILFWKEDTNDVWPSLLSEFLHCRADMVERLFPLPEDRRAASLASMLWPWVRTLEPMERFLAQQVLIQAVVSDFTGFRQRLQSLPDGRHPDQTRQAVEAILTALRTPIYAQEFDPETRCLTGDRVVALENDRDWEAHLIEGIWVEEHGDRFYMFYSGNDFSTPEYGTGVAVASSPLGPYRKMERPLLRSTQEWVGPGHPSLAQGPDGDPWLFLHAFMPGQAGYRKFRALLAVPICFEPETVRLR